MRLPSCFFAFLLCFALPAAAQPAGAPPSGCPRPATTEHGPPNPAVVAARQAMRAACMVDMQKYCANVPHGCGRPMECLRAHTSQLSAGCTSAMAQFHAARMQSHAPAPAPAAPH